MLHHQICTDSVLLGAEGSGRLKHMADNREQWRTGLGIHVHNNLEGRGYPWIAFFLRHREERGGWRSHQRMWPDLEGWTAGGPLDEKRLFKAQPTPQALAQPWTGDSSASYVRAGGGPRKVESPSGLQDSCHESLQWPFQQWETPPRYLHSSFIAAGHTMVS